MSMLDVISGATGAFLLVMLVLAPYYGKTVREEEVQDVREAITSAEDNLNRTQTALVQAQSDAERVQILDQAVTQAQQDLKAVQNGQLATMAAIKSAHSQAQKEAKEAEERLGLVLQDQNLIFVIDVSRSMGPPEGTAPPFSTFENSIVAVVAGVKMLVATMDETYKIDIVFFPNQVGNFPGTQVNQDYDRLWGELRSVTEDRKYEAYEFLSALQPFDGTPTEGHSTTCLKNRNIGMPPRLSSCRTAHQVMTRGS